MLQWVFWWAKSLVFVGFGRWRHLAVYRVIRNPKSTQCVVSRTTVMRQSRWFFLDPRMENGNNSKVLGGMLWNAASAWLNHKFWMFPMCALLDAQVRVFTFPRRLAWISLEFKIAPSYSLCLLFFFRLFLCAVNIHVPDMIRQVLFNQFHETCVLLQNAVVTVSLHLCCQASHHARNCKQLFRAIAVGSKGRKALQTPRQNRRAPSFDGRTAVTPPTPDCLCIFFCSARDVEFLPASLCRITREALLCNIACTVCSFLPAVYLTVHGCFVPLGVMKED